jgi:hypothetical protein
LAIPGVKNFGNDTDWSGEWQLPKCGNFRRFQHEKIKYKYDIPDRPIYNCDETNAFFVPRAGRTIAKSDTKRVRLIGVGKITPR